MHATCCEQGAMWIVWEKKHEQKFDKRGRLIVQEGEGPERDGWAISLGDYFQCNVNFCPWCGKELGEVKQ